MRLINTETLQLEEFWGQLPSYAILSHTWGRNEITYEDVNAGQTKSIMRWGKLREACWQASQDGLSYVWVDTCCINKSSSAELSESINSRYRWYQDARICYGYLEDNQEVGDFQKSRWFSRGWTLQELLAPEEMIFLGSDWQNLGTRNELAEEISLVTHSDWKCLLGFQSRAYIRDTSIAKKMVWAARRTTIREEDLSYCLLGLFDVNMPLLYGDGGPRAFQRLQQEIIRQTLDHSFLLWIWHQHLGTWSIGDINFLPRHPRCFVGCESIATSGQLVLPFALTNRGLQLRLPVYQS
jgi:hypothetical protein